MTPENRLIPAWAQRERQSDLGWMRINYIRAENLPRMLFIRVFRTVATTALEDAGRGAIIVHTTLQPLP